MGSELQVYTKRQKLQLWSERVKASGMSVADWYSAKGISKYTYYECSAKYLLLPKRQLRKDSLK